MQGLGVRSEVNLDALVPDQDKTIEEGGVLPWNIPATTLSLVICFGKQIL
jgi:excinuclease UvrABC ATPase subunit